MIRVTFQKPLNPLKECLLPNSATHTITKLRSNLELRGKSEELKVKVETAMAVS